MPKELLQRLMARIKNLVGTGTVTGATTGVLQIKTATGRTNDRIKRVHNYGFMSRPLVGARTYNLFIGGVTARGFTVNVEDERHQIDLEPGEVAVLDDKGNLVHFTENGIKVNSMAKIEVTAKQDITVNTSANILQNGSNIKLNNGAGVITCESVCPFTGTPHADGSAVVTAGKN
ncbi:phage baseplate assembly protein [Vibrio sp. JC009]|uniref:phage baseplate assembly protein domain-containing protein n=1 Tax=Vibrio sp. JC009 TaxID=2912314 RepID=UPI0023B11D7F|nr:phage baseplate assembly protein [Vibrio sp. JC009]WED23499.1 phage baseplate assembly protein [Vibrio sp. JC009]